MNLGTAVEIGEQNSFEGVALAREFLQEILPPLMADGRSAQHVYHAALALEVSKHLVGIEKRRSGHLHVDTRGDPYWKGLPDRLVNLYRALSEVEERSTSELFQELNETPSRIMNDYRNHDRFGEWLVEFIEKPRRGFWRRRIRS
jgi:hypothetical protein